MQRKGTLPGKIFALCIPERRFAGLFGCTARISCQSQLILDTWRRYIARKGRFFRPRALLGCMKRNNCHGLPLKNASERYLATDGTQERIAREYRHCQSLESAFRDDLAITSLLRTHRGEVLPSTSPRECAMATSCRGRPLRECISVTYRQERPRLPGACSSRRREHAGKTSCSADNGKASNPPSGDETVRPTQGLNLGHKRILQRNRRRRRRVGRRRANETSINSTTCGDPSKKP